MITQELISYIQKQTIKNTPKDLIIVNLLKAGWHKEDIDEGFLIIEKKQKNNEIEIFNKELPKGQESKTEIISDKTVETPRVWVPMGMPIKEAEKVEISNLDLNDELNEPSEKVEIINPKYFDVKEELIPTLIPKTQTNSPEIILPETKITSPEALSSKVENGSPEVGLTKKEISTPSVVLPKTESSLSVDNLNSSAKKNSLAKNLPQSAMLSSYKSDLLLVDRTEEELSQPKNRKILKWIIFVSILILAASLFWYFANGDTNFSFIKKDPKILLLNNSKNLSSLKSYKTETRIEISSPSFSDITYGLISGEAVSSANKDFLMVDMSGIVNHKDGKLLSDVAIVAKGSILENNIFSNIKNDGTSLFISNSSFDQVLKDGNLYPGFIQMNKDQMNSMVSLFPQKIESKLKKIDIYTILSGGMASYIDGENLVEYNELINKADIIEKGEEDIKGIKTYHYSISANTELFKKLIDKISTNLTQNFSEEDVSNLESIFGSSTINSFDVWVGKGDSNIYQYSFSIDIPLSKIIGFEDASIGDNKINIVWKTIYYDFDIANNIIIPEDFISATDFSNLIKETRVKNEIIFFEKLASSLLKKEGVYGKNSNTNGDCINPVSGSLYSPLGHTKKAVEEISSISLFINKMLAENDNIGFCFSNSKEWSLSVPVFNNYNEVLSDNEKIKYYFCVDSTGSNKELISPQTGVICK